LYKKIKCNTKHNGIKKEMSGENRQNSIPKSQMMYTNLPNYQWKSVTTSVKLLYPQKDHILPSKKKLI
jgi:hypothetical protein